MGAEAEEEDANVEGETQETTEGAEGVAPVEGEETDTEETDLPPPSSFSPVPGLEAYSGAEAMIADTVENAPVFGDVISEILRILGKTPEAPTESEITGLASQVSINRFVSTASDVETNWATLTPIERGEALGAAANAELNAYSVPSCSIDVKTIGANGLMIFGQWRIDLNITPFETTTPVTANVAGVADTAYHEARHAEQWHRMARLKAGDGWTAAQIAAAYPTGMGIPAAKDLANNQIITAHAVRCGIRVSRAGDVCPNCGVSVYPANFGPTALGDPQFRLFADSSHSDGCRWGDTELESKT